MKRITKRDEFGNADIDGMDMSFILGLKYEDMVLLTNALNRLAEYEDDSAITKVAKEQSHQPRWIKIKGILPSNQCSECDYRYTYRGWDYNYCPKCGSKMELFPLWVYEHGNM